MESVINNFYTVLNAVFYYIKSAIALVTSNVYFLGFTIVVLIWANKSLKVGRIISAKG